MDTVKKYLPLSVLGIFLIANVLIWYSVFYWESRQNLLVTFFDIGQGDATFIVIPNGSQILIDGGPSDAILAKLGRLMPFWDRSIDLLILTHPHADHATGLVEVLKRYDVGAVVESDVNYSTPEYREWREIIAQKQMPVLAARAGQRIDAGGGAALDILWPVADFSGRSLKNVHEAMAASRLFYGSTTVLLMGDAEKPIEIALARTSAPLASDILKVGHHGSKTSSTEEFLRAVSPEVAVISVGRKNRYGHPHQEVLDRLRDFGIAVFRTDVDGDIRLQSNGRSYAIVR